MSVGVLRFSPPLPTSGTQITTRARSSTGIGTTETLSNNTVFVCSSAISSTEISFGLRHGDRASREKENQQSQITASARSSTRIGTAQMISNDRVVVYSSPILSTEISCGPGHGDRRASHEKENQRSHGSIQSSLLSKLSTTLQKRNLLQPQQKVLVAVSGGQDSVSLIFLLKRLQATWGWKLGIVHCDHQWSSSSRSQASHVAQIAAHLELDFYQAVATQNVAGESAARTWRYGILHRIASSHGYSAIVTAHTSSDRVETLLHNLFRGSGLHGLQALTWKRWSSANTRLTSDVSRVKDGAVEYVDSHSQGFRRLAELQQIALVRPLLDISRTELRKFCDIERLPLWPDPSNFFMDIRRNKIRHQLLPFLRESFQASIDLSLNRWAEIVSGEDAFLEELCESIRKRAESSYSDEGVKGRSLKVQMIRNLHVAVQRRVIKQFVEAFSGRSLGFDHVEHLRRTCIVHPCKNGQRFSLPGNIVLQFMDDNFLVYENGRK